MHKLGKRVLDVLAAAFAASGATFVGRISRLIALCVVLIAGSLGIGVAGYMFFAQMSPVDAFLNAAMILGGMGPVAPLESTAAKIFAALYALYSGVLLLAVTGIILAPVLHCVLRAIDLDEKSND